VVPNNSERVGPGTSQMMRQPGVGAGPVKLTINALTVEAASGRRSTPTAQMLSLRNALSMLLAGLAAGLAGAFALTRALKSLLFEVSAPDPAALAVACVLMTLVGILAALIPASRAAGVDPITVLRDEG